MIDVKEVVEMRVETSQEESKERQGGEERAKEEDKRSQARTLEGLRGKSGRCVEGCEGVKESVEHQGEVRPSDD